MSLYYVRHGETDWNLQFRLQGRNDIPLNDTGMVQAEKTGQLFRDIKIDKIFCSPMIRTRQTAAIINQTTDCEIVLEERLIERCFGDLEGMNMHENKTYLWDFEKDLCPHAESMHDFFKRVQSFLEEIQPEIQDQNYLIVAHGGVFLPVQDYFEKIDTHSDLMQIIPKNCTVTKFG